MRAYLTSAGADVSEAVFHKRLLLSSDQSHLLNGIFDPESMIRMLDAAAKCAVEDGHAGLWASGDMSWEFGSHRDFSKLVEYERGLEGLFAIHPTLRGVCQYHVDMLPEDVVGICMDLHPTIYVNETLSMLNESYIDP